MHETVFMLALAVIIAAAIFFLLGATFSDIKDTSDTSISNIENARRISLNNSISYLQQ